MKERLNRAQQILILAVRGYQRVISPALAGMLGQQGCRFEPTCSHYAAEAVAEHGALKGSMLAAGRVCRCQPWGGSGSDPVPRKVRHDKAETVEPFPALIS